MRKIKYSILLGLLLLLWSTVPAFAKDVTVQLDGNILSCLHDPVIENDRVLVPMRDTVDYQMLVPAWLVFYQQQMGAAEPLTAFIAVNAVDGSTIDLKVRFGG